MLDLAVRQYAAAVGSFDGRGRVLCASRRSTTSHVSVARFETGSLSGEPASSVEVVRLIDGVPLVDGAASSKCSFLSMVRDDARWTEWGIHKPKMVMPEEPMARFALDRAAASSEGKEALGDVLIVIDTLDSPSQDPFATKLPTAHRRKLASLLRGCLADLATVDDPRIFESRRETQATAVVQSHFPLILRAIEAMASALRSVQERTLRDLGI